MPETWFFHKSGENDHIILRSRLDSEDGTIGDAFSECVPGQTWLNLPYDELAKHGGGTITIENDIAKIEPKLKAVDHDPFRKGLNG